MYIYIYIEIWYMYISQYIMSYITRRELQTRRPQSPWKAPCTVQHNMTIWTLGVEKHHSKQSIAKMCKPDPHISIQGMLGMLCYFKLFQVGQFESAFKRPRQSHQWQLTPGMIFLSCQHLWATSLKVQHPSQHTSARLSTPDCETNSTMNKNWGTIANNKWNTLKEFSQGIMLSINNFNEWDFAPSKTGS